MAIAGGRALSARRPCAVKVVDTTGAGDAFNGGFLAALLAGRPVADCLDAGVRLGSLSTRAAGGLDGLPSRRWADACLMKICIIGGAGVRVPLLVNGLAQCQSGH